jgi:hypothetical protein
LDPPSLLYKGLCVIPGGYGGGVNWPNRGVDHRSPSSAERNERQCFKTILPLDFRGLF